MSRKTFLKLTMKKLLLSLLVSVFLISFTSCDREGEAGNEKEDKPSNLIQLDSKSIEAANLKIEEVSLRSLKNILQVPGKVQFNENKLAHVGSRVPGRVVE